jgi:hypothetical protein
MARRKDYWIQHAIKHKGSLKKWLHKHYGSKAFKKDGTIKITFLEKLRKKKSLPSKIKHKINLAITLHKLRKK